GPGRLEGLIDGNGLPMSAHAGQVAGQVSMRSTADLDGESQRLLDRSVSPEDAGRRAVELAKRTAHLRPGTVLAREWNGQMHRVAVSGVLAPGPPPGLLSGLAAAPRVQRADPWCSFWRTRHSVFSSSRFPGRRLASTSAGAPALCASTTERR